MALSIFSLVLGIGFAMYFSVDRIQKKNLRSNIVYGEARYWMDRLIDEVQSASIYYDPSLPYPATQPVYELHITNKLGQRVRYFLDDTDFDGLYDTLKRQVWINPEETLSSPEIKMTRLAFYIDPFTASSTDSPKVTITLQATDLQKIKPIIVNLQTTAGLRSY